VSGEVAVVSPTFRYANGRDPWERQLGEPGDQHDWFNHWRNDGHRRSIPRTAAQFEVTPARVSGAAKRNQWTERLAAFKADNARQLQERYSDLIESGLVPYAQAFTRLSAAAVTLPLDKLTPDRALMAATAALRMMNEPGVADLIRVSGAAGAEQRELDTLDVVLDALAGRWPEAHDAVLDALQQAVHATEHGIPAGPATDGDAEGGVEGGAP
jgi:hypothetical protein